MQKFALKGNMNEIYLTIGILQLFVSGTVSVYLLILYIQKYQFPNKSVSLSHGFSTILMAIFFLITSTKLPGEEISGLQLENVSVTSLEGLNYTSNLEYTNTFDILDENDVNISTPETSGVAEVMVIDPEREYFVKLLNLRPYSTSNRKSKGLSHDIRMTCKEMLYLYLLLVYSFAHGMIYLIAYSLLYRKNENSTDNFGNSSNEIVDAQHPDASSNNCKKLRIVLVSSVWLFPITASSLVLLMVNSNKVNRYVFPEQILNSTKISGDKILHTANYTNASLDQEIENVLDKVYGIMKNINLTEGTTSHISFINLLNKDIQTCSDEGMVLKMYLFLLFIFSYSLTISYSKNAVKTKCAYSIDRTPIFCFAVGWLPAVLEIIFRKYISNTSPSLVSELVLLFGTFNQILVNISNTHTARKFIKTQNFIAPNKQ